MNVTWKELETLIFYSKLNKLMKPFTIAGKALSYYIYLILSGTWMFVRNLCFRLQNKIIITGNEDPKDYQNKLKEISKSDEYKDFVAEKLVYQTSLLLSRKLIYGFHFYGVTLSTLARFHENDKEISGTTFGFLAYGSGS
jgi:hypothetical protein